MQIMWDHLARADLQETSETKIDSVLSGVLDYSRVLCPYSILCCYKTTDYKTS